MVQITTMSQVDPARSNMIMPSINSSFHTKKTHWKPSLKRFKHGLRPGKGDANRLTAQESELLHNLSNWQWEAAVETREVSKKRQSPDFVTEQPLHLQMTPIYRPDQDQDQAPLSADINRKSIPKRPRRPSSMSDLNATPHMFELAVPETKSEDRKPSLPKPIFDDDEFQEFIASSCLAAAQDIHFFAVDNQSPVPESKEDLPTKFIADLLVPKSQRTSTSTQSRDSLLMKDIMEFFEPQIESAPRITSWFDDEKDDDWCDMRGSVSNENQISSGIFSRIDGTAGSSFEIYRGWESE